MNPNKALWEKGDFTRIAETMRESGEANVKARKNGNAPRLRTWQGARSARMLGVDIARNHRGGPRLTGA